MTSVMWLVTGLAAIGLGAIFSTLFYALHELSRSRLEELAVQQKSAALRSRIAKVLEDPRGHAVATALPRVMCHMIAVVAAVFWITRLRGVQSPEWLEVTVGLTAASLSVWLLGLVVPASVARHAGEETVIAWSRLVRVVYIVSRPFRRFVWLLDDIIGRMSGTGINPQQDAQDEVLSLVEEAKQEGQFDQFERDTIASIMRFRDKTVQQIMTPRTEIEAIELTNNLGEITSHIRRTRHSRIPVYEGTIDRIVGAFYVKDLMKWLAGDKSRAGTQFDFRKLLRPALFVPETKTVRELLSELIAKKVHIAMVADEYGGTAGLVTIEDIVEQITGDIRDEYEPAIADDPDVTIDKAKAFADVDARLYIHEANNQLRELGVELPVSDDYDTVGGYVTVTLGRIPQSGELVPLDGVKITVLEAEPTHVERLRIEKAEPEADAGEPRQAEQHA